MAEGQDSKANREIVVGGRARALLNAIAYFENKRVGRGRVGRAPNLGMNNSRGVTRQEVGPPRGRAHALSTLVPRLGVFHHGEGDVEASLFQHPPHLHQPPPRPLGRGFPLPSPPTLPPSLEDGSPPMRHQEAPS